VNLCCLIREKQFGALFINWQPTDFVRFPPKVANSNQIQLIPICRILSNYHENVYHFIANVAWNFLRNVPSHRKQWHLPDSDNIWINVVKFIELPQLIETFGYQWQIVLKDNEYFLVWNLYTLLTSELESLWRLLKILNHGFVVKQN